MRRFLLHVLPDGFHRIRHYGLFANGHRTDRSQRVECCSMFLPSNPTAPSTINRRSLHQSSSRQPVHAAAVA
jgi:hypothetical protein